MCRHWASPWENLPYGILLRVMLYTCTVIPFAKMAILQYFENGRQLLVCCIFIVWSINILIRDVKTDQYKIMW